MALYLCRRKLFSSALNLAELSNSTISLYFLASNTFSYHYSTTTLNPQCAPSIADYLINSHQLSPDTASKAFDKAESIVKYLKDFGFSTSQLDSLLKRRPRLLSSNLDFTIKPKIHVLQNLGFSSSDIVELLSTDPYLLSRGVDNQLGRSIFALKSFLGSEGDVVKVLKVSTLFLKYNLDKTMVPNIELLKSYGVSEEQMQRFVFHFPRFLLYKPETMKEYIKRAEKMGLSRDSKMFLHAVRVVSSMSEESWKSKIQVFHNLGFTQEDILLTFRKCPHIFAASERKIKEVSDILISAAKPDGKFVVRNPDLLLFSVKRRIMPRFKVMDTLLERNLIKRRPSLKTLLKLSGKQFCAKYVDPHSDVVGELYTAHQGL
uniref:Uncharacterized protein n=2 Tax=Opuntia streptacantha TaxID=393608 RepID=A0A7C9B402_OPUST